MDKRQKQKTVVIGAGPVGSLAALYAASRGHDVEIYELRGGECFSYVCFHSCSLIPKITTSTLSYDKESVLTPCPDLRDPATTPLNFTRSINLALSERGINAMRHAGQPKLIDHVMAATIPMRGRMIHGRRATGDLYEESQEYDVHGRVRLSLAPSSSTRNAGG